MEIVERSPVFCCLREKDAIVDVPLMRLDVFPLPWKFDVSPLRVDSM